MNFPSSRQSYYKLGSRRVNTCFNLRLTYSTHFSPFFFFPSKETFPFRCYAFDVDDFSTSITTFVVVTDRQTDRKTDSKFMPTKKSQLVQKRKSEKSEERRNNCDAVEFGRNMCVQMLRNVRGIFG